MGDLGGRGGAPPESTKNSKPLNKSSRNVNPSGTRDKTKKRWGWLSSEVPNRRCDEKNTHIARHVSQGGGHRKTKINQKGRLGTNEICSFLIYVHDHAAQIWQVPMRITWPTVSRRRILLVVIAERIESPVPSLRVSQGFAKKLNFVMPRFPYFVQK